MAKLNGLTFWDRVLNSFYRTRYKFYAKFFKRKLKDHSPRIKKGLDLVFEDDFDEVSWSRKSTDMWRKWGIGEHWGWFHPNNGRSWWTEPVLNGDSTITLGTKKDPKTFHKKEGNNYWYAAPVNFEPVETLVVPFSCGGLSTGHNDKDGNTLFKQQYGRWECRCKVPAVRGIRSAYWTWGSTWPPEIDIFEIDGRDKHNDQKINLHFGNEEEGRDSLGSTLGALRRDGEWQEFVLQWSPGKIEMITDGLKIFRCTKKDVVKWFDADIAKQWVLVYQSVIWSTVEDEVEPDEDGWYSKFLVDYVRVYKNKE